MTVALIAPSPVPFVWGGAENLWHGLYNALVDAGHKAELIKLPSPERNFWEIIDSYRRFSELDLSHFDRVISTKYPAWMVDHPRHIVYMQHKLRGLYDTYPASLPIDLPQHRALDPLRRWLDSNPLSRGDLPELWEILESLRARSAALPSEWFALPSPLIRSLVHAMDRIALSPKAIDSFAAISATVADRADYFPSTVAVRVLYHPSSLSPAPSQRYECFFTASRLDRAKRLDLLIRAYRSSSAVHPLWIAGDGPERAHLETLAENDPRIRFLGFVTPQELSGYYSSALAVPFVPYDEDLGLVTLEAASAAKPVITLTDSGGAAELTRHGVTGCVVSPDEQSLSEAFSALSADPSAARRMGAAAREEHADVTWKALVEALFPIRRYHKNRISPKIVVVNTFSIAAPVTGGQQRIYQLYRHLARISGAEILHIALGASSQEDTRILGENFAELRLPSTPEFRECAEKLSAELGASAGDLAVSLYHDRVPLWPRRVADHAADADWVILSHPYADPIVRLAYRGPIIYEAHNVEYRLKSAIYPENSWALQEIFQIERECAARARHCIAVSGEDARELSGLYGIDRKSIGVIANGAEFPPEFPPLPGRWERFYRFLFPSRPLALYAASWHAPNVEAGRELVSIAAAVAQMDFIIIGTLCNHPMWQEMSLPKNLRLLGVLSDYEKELLQNSCDIGLNPVMSGSGTNLKLLDYASAGISILTTPFGARGGVIDPGLIHCAELSRWPEVLRRFAKNRGETERLKRKAAWKSVDAYARWETLARHFASMIGISAR